MREKSLAKLGIIAYGLSLTLIGASVVFWILNFQYEPKYGDTVEYWQLAKTLQIDSWRTLAYPLVLHFISSFSFINPLIMIYFAQTLVSFIAVYYFFLTLDTIVGVKNKKVNSRIIFLSLLLISFPLINHFNLSVLTDSLAASFLVIVVAAFTRIFILNILSWPNIMVGVVGVIGSVLIRSERFIYLFILVVLLLAWQMTIKNFKMAKVALFFIVIIISFNFGNQVTQKTDLGRPKVSVMFAIFERTVQGRFVKLFPKMPQTIKERVSLDLAEKWDKDPNVSLAVGSILSDTAGKKAIAQASMIAFVDSYVEIIYQSTGDFVEYLIAPLRYVQESLVQSKDPTLWTNTRMDGWHPIVANIYRALSFILLILLSLLSIYGLREAIKNQNLKKTWVFWGVVIFLLSFFFAARTSLDFHIRYALPIYMIEIGLMIWLSSRKFYKSI